MFTEYSMCPSYANLCACWVWFDFELIDCSHILLYLYIEIVHRDVALRCSSHTSHMCRQRAFVVLAYIRSEYKFRLDTINLHLMLWRVAGRDDHKFHNNIPHSHVSFIILQLGASAHWEIIFMSTRNFTQSKRSYRKKKHIMCGGQKLTWNKRKKNRKLLLWFGCVHGCFLYAVVMYLCWKYIMFI